MEEQNNTPEQQDQNQPQPQPPVQPQPQPQNAPPPPQMSAALGAVGSSIKHNINAFRNDASVSIWVKCLTALTWIFCAFGIIGGLIIAINGARTPAIFGFGGSFDVATFFGLWLGSWLGTLLATAALMVFIGIARDLAEIKANTRK